MSDASPTTACPDVATLRALLDGTLLDDQQTATQAHVDCCPICETALRQMTAGGASWIGMAEKLKGGSADDPNLAAALDRLKADDGSGGERNESTDPQRTLDFLQPADDPKLLGKLGQHEISEVVGWGGMGVVLKAYDPSLHRVVAVKVLASHLAHHAVARKRFIREAQAAAAVCHDNVVTIHAIEDGVGSLFQAAVTNSESSAGDGRPEKDSRPLHATLPKIIMQFVAGGSLQERIDQEAPLELKEILRIAMQTAAGLAAAHAQGVVHRDVKPANILLENGVQRVKLTDFGLARVMDDASLTLSGVIAGTPQYMAPEQAWGRDVDARADLFSLGAVMYAMCSGHSPFRARTTMAVLKRVCEAAPRPLRAINPDVPSWLEAIIEKLLAKNPDDRFQSATEVSELLSRWLAHVQQPNVVPAPQQIASVPGRAERVPNRALLDNLTAKSAQALLAMSELQRRPEELRHRLPIAGFVFLVLLVIGIPVVLFLLSNLTSRSQWTPADSFNHWMSIVGVGAAFVVLIVMLSRWLLGGSSRLKTQTAERARRGSPDPADSPDRRSPELSRGANSDGDLRSRPSAGSGDPCIARRTLSLKLALAPVLVTVAVLSVFLVMIVEESGARNLDSYLGFSLFQLAMTFALCSAFYCAWNTTSWLVWIGAMLFFPVAGNAFVLAVTYQGATQIVVMTCGLQALLAFAFWFGLLFVRPLMTYVSGEGMRERLSGWQQLFAIACFTIVGTPLLFLTMYWLSYSPRSVPQTVETRDPTHLIFVPTTKADSDDPSSGRYPKPKLLNGNVPGEIDPLELPPPQWQHESRNDF